MPITDRHFSQVEELFLAALDLPEKDRPALLDARCGSDPGLRQAVEELLNAREEAAAFLRDPTVGADDGAWSNGELQPGAEVGPYKIIRCVGEGGFAVVYLAEQQEPIARRVALKVLKAGMDTRGILARFEAERHTLARMDHPNIARVLDAGATAGGRPFFAMEFVDGPSIVRYVEKKKLGLREKLQLFITACHAVQHAHHKGIIHRDLKPSNILVADQDGAAAPKVIDFGIARATLPAGSVRQTQSRQFLGTPAYVSPEQASGDANSPVDVRSDIYSLGVLLYEMLTGATPFGAERLRSSSLEEVSRILREEEPPCPSVRSANRQLRGDLDWITLKALAKEPSRRYDSVASFIRDVERHLADEPVEAGPPGMSYRFRKFIRRHRISTAAAALALGGLLAGGAVASWGLVQARREAAAAKREAQKANVVIGLMNHMFESADPNVARGSGFTVRQLLDDFGAELGAQLSAEPAVEFSLRLTMGRAYHGLGEYLQAQTHLDRAAALAQPLFGSQSPEMAAARRWQGIVLSDMGHAAEGHEALAEARRIESALPSPSPQEMLLTLAGLAESEFKLGNLDEAARLAASVRESESSLPPAQQRNSAAMARLHTRVLVRQGRGEEAKSFSQATLDEARRQHGAEHPRTILALLTLADACLDQSQLEEGRRMAEEAVELSTRTLGENHPTTLAARQSLASFHKEQGDLVAAEKMHASVLEAQRKTLGESHPDTLSGMLGLVEALVAQGREKEAEKIVSSAFQVSRKQYGEGNPITLEALGELAKIIVREGRYKDVEPIALRALAVSRKLYGDDHENTLDLQRIIAFLFWQQQRYEEALTHAQAAAAGYEKKLGRGHLLTLNCLSVVAQILDSAGNRAPADRLVMELRGRMLEINKPGGGLAEMAKEFRMPLEKRGLIKDSAQLVAHATQLKEKAGLNTAAEYRDLAKLANLASHCWITVDIAAKAAAQCRKDPKSDPRILVDALSAEAVACRSLALPKERIAALTQAAEIADAKLGPGDALTKLVRQTLAQCTQADADARRRLDARRKAWQQAAAESGESNGKALDIQLAIARDLLTIGEMAEMQAAAKAILTVQVPSSGPDPGWESRRWDASALILRGRIRDRTDSSAANDYSHFLRDAFSAKDLHPRRFEWFADYARQIIYRNDYPTLYEGLTVIFECNETEPWKSGTRTVLVPFCSSWKFLCEDSPVPSGWTGTAFDDSAWLEAPAAFGSKAGGLATAPLMQRSKFVPAWQFRQRFDVPNPSAVAALRLRMRALGEMEVFVNGRPIQVLAMPQTSSAEEADTVRFFPRIVEIDPSVLTPGSNLIAVECRAHKSESILFDGQLEAALK